MYSKSAFACLLDANIKPRYGEEKYIQLKQCVGETYVKCMIIIQDNNPTNFVEILTISVSFGP